MTNRSWRPADPSGRFTLSKYCRPTFMGRPLKTVVLVIPSGVSVTASAIE